MRQTANIGPPRIRQNPPNAHGETPTISKRDFAPSAFNLNQSSAVCLPLVSESQRLIWVNSNQIDLQLDGAAELEKAFDKFPYLTPTQTEGLARRCSLHPDQVKVWFMLQRLRYGISWDYKDICEIRGKFKSNLGKEEQQNGMRKEVKEDSGEMKVQEKEVKECGEIKAGEVREEMEKGKKKRKRNTSTNRMRKKRTNQQEEGVTEGAGGVEIRRDKVERQWQTSTPTSLFTRKKKEAKAKQRLPPLYEWPAQKSFVVPDERLDASSPLILQAFEAPPLTELQGIVHSFPSSASNVTATPVNGGFDEKPEMEAQPQGGLHEEFTNDDSTVTDVSQLRDYIMNNNPVVADVSQEYSQEVYALPTRIRWRTKTQTQLAMMKVAFARCQYPDSECYNMLSEEIGVPRYVLVQWFGDMRYYIKRGKPRWMNEEQHSQALANIRYRQLLKALEKEQSSEGDRKPTIKMKLETGKSYSDGESVQVHLE
ncbi:homeobox and leucine zipper encoding b [Scomber scombrus]|uniref:Homeobox and leucine zipper encoding b n=1 Tax=Scomber scombrus TaxID=13677 RepID=A0AAV1N1R6_SCOSC